MTPGDTVAFWVCAVIGMFGVYCAALLLLGAAVGWLRSRQAKRDMERKANQYKLSRKPLVLLAVLCLAASPLQAATTADTTVKIETDPDHAGRGSSGSGVIVRLADGRMPILTCRHVVSGHREVTISVYRGKRYRALVRGIDSRTDLAILQAAFAGDESASRLSDRAPVQGETVYLTGYPRGVPEPNTRSGTFRGYLTPAFTSSGAAATSILSTGGDSGGGIYRADGTLAGILAWGEGSVSTGNGPTWQDLRSFVERSCGPGGCYPGYRPGGISGIGIGIGAIRQPSMPPSGGLGPQVQPPTIAPVSPTPASPASPSVTDLERESDARMKRIEAALAHLAARRPEPGPAGPPGRPGADGRPGPAGKDGAPGKDADAATIEALRAEIAQLKSQRLTVELLDAAGNVVQTDSFGPGKPLRIRLKPVE